MMRCHYKRLILVTLMSILLILTGQNACGSPPCIVTGLDKTFGGPLDDEGYSILQTSDGGYIFTGRTSSYGAGNNDILLAKADKDGNITWEKTFGGLKDDEGYSVEQTADGGYILVGKTKSSGSGMHDIVLIKVDQNGNRIWDKTFGGSLDDEGYSMRQIADGGYILVGKTKSSGSGLFDVLMLKIDQNGNKVWERTFGGPLDDIGDSIQQTSDGGYIIAGTTSSFGAGEADAWLIKTDQDGNKIWNQTFGGPKSELNPWGSGWSVQETDDGEYLLVGSTNSIGSGGYDVWFIKTDLNGTPIIDKTFGGPLDDEGDSIIQTGAGEYVLVGSTSSNGSGGYDAWLIKIDRNGNKIWDQTFGGELDDKGYSIQQTIDEGYVFIGKTKSNNPLRPRTNGCCGNVPGISSNFDIWLIKIKSGSPTINVQPASVITCEGQEVSFRIEATGTQPLTYQWKKDGSEINGASTNAYSIPIVSAEDAGSYSVMVRNSCGWIESDQATLKINSKPSIQVQPLSQEISEDSAVTFSVEATGSEPLTYQWKRNGENITGANANTYYIARVNENDGGSYSVVVSNTCGFVESNQATLTVHIMPLIEVQPVYEVVCEGSEVAFNVEATGTEPLIYQWRRNGENITGANANTYYIPRVSINDAGSYSAIVSNCCGTVESIIADLTVNPKPAIQVQPANQIACEGSEVSFSVQATGTEPLTYQWVKNDENITGASESIYSIPIVSASDAGDYSVIVSSCCCGWVESSPASLLINTKPSILIQPASQSICEGSEVSFSVEATGTEPLVYQWMKDGAEIFGANTGEYSIPNAGISDSGSYSVVVSNCCGLTISNVAILTIGAKPSILVQPVSQTVCEGSLVTFSVEASGTEPLTYQWMKDGTEIAGANSNSHSILSATETDIGTYTVMVSNSCGQVESEAATLTLNVKPSVLVQPVSQTVCEGSPVTFSIEASGTEPLDYQWMKDGVQITNATSNSYDIPSATASDTGSYTVVVSNSCGQVESEVATLTLNVRPSILAQPASQTVCEGSLVIFSVEASGTEPLTYQWMKDGMQITNATSNSYSISSVAASDTGTYAVVVSNSCGQIESDTATLAMNVRPSILVQPIGQTVCEGSQVTFSVEAIGTEPLAYQWMKDGAEIAEANSNSYSIPSATASDTGNYAVTVSNSCGQIESEVAALAINVGPSILVQPVSQTVCEGSLVTFSVEASGTEPLTYQWMKDGTEIAGANSNSHSILSATETDIGTYTVMVSNSCGQVESEAAALTLNVKPSVLVQPVSQTVCEGSPVTFSIEASGTEPLAHQWTKDGAEILGANASSYTVPIATASDTGTYAIIVSSICGQVESETATLTINVRPSILVQPIGQTVCEGSQVTFSVEAIGTEPLAYQWMKDGIEIYEANASSYAIPTATANDIGSYTVRVSNSCGQIESEVTALAINVGPSILVQPVSQTVCEGLPVTFSVEASGTEPLTYQWMKDGLQITNANSNSYDIPSATTSDTGSYNVVVSNSCGQIESDTATLAMNVRPSILVQPISQTICEGSQATFSVEAIGTEPLAYQWMKDGAEILGANESTYTVPTATASDMGSYTVVVSNSCGQVESEAATLTLNVKPSVLVQPVSQTVCEGSPVTFSIEASGTEPLTFQWMKDGAEIAEANSNSYSIPSATASDIGTYTVIVSNSCGQIESEVASLAVNVKPSILVQPISQTICEGSQVTFSVEAIGTEPLAYQWMKDGTEIYEANASSYAIPTATANDIGSYTVRVSNSCGQIESDTATLAMNVRPSILVQPISQTVCEGSQVTFSVEASGTMPLAFQWMKDGTEIAGANSNSYSIPSATASDTGSYNVVVSNSCGQVESEVASLAINIGPSILVQPISQTVCEGSPVVFSVEASGTVPLTYQWMKDGVEIAEANSNSYSIFSATKTDIGNYAVMVSNSCGQVESEVATLTLNVGPSILVQPISQTVCEGSQVTFSVEASGTMPLAFQWMKDGTEIAGANSNSYSILSATETDIGNYAVIVSNSCGQIESDTAALAMNVRPSILVQPASQTVCEGSSVMFSVEASGTEPLTYQWMKDGSEIYEADEAVYNILCATTRDSGSYSVRVSNNCDLIESEVAVLAVCSQPAIKNRSTIRESAATVPTMIEAPPSITIQLNKVYNSRCKSQTGGRV